MAADDSLPFGFFSNEVTTFADVDGALDQLMKFFGGDSTRFMIYFGRFLDSKNPVGGPSGEGAVGENFNWWKEADSYLQSSQQDDDLATMQKLRRRTSMAAIQTKLAGDDGRKLSSVEKAAFVVDAAIELAATEDKEEAEAFGEIDEADLEEDPETAFKYLPYNPIPGDELDSALAEQINLWEIDVDIRRSGKKKRKGNKAVYKMGGAKFFVRYIHGVLVCKDPGTKSWVELVPKLREQAGMEPVDPDAPMPIKKKKGRIKVSK